VNWAVDFNDELDARRQEINDDLNLPPGACGTAELTNLYRQLCAHAHKPILTKCLSKIRGTNLPAFAAQPDLTDAQILESWPYEPVDDAHLEFEQRLFQRATEIKARIRAMILGFTCVFRRIRSAVPGASDQDSGHPIRIRSEATRTGAGQTVGWVSGWGFRPFWRRMDEPRRVSTCALCTSRSQMASAIV